MILNATEKRGRTQETVGRADLEEIVVYLFLCEVKSFTLNDGKKTENDGLVLGYCTEGDT